jgi:hypothetical protein
VFVAKTAVANQLGDQLTRRPVLLGLAGGTALGVALAALEFYIHIRRQAPRE